jgi:hypothetical protein
VRRARSTVDADPVGAVDIARRLKVADATVKQWQWRGELPPHRWSVSGRPAWDWNVDVVPWATATRRFTDDKEEIPTVQDPHNLDWLFYQLLIRNSRTGISYGDSRQPFARALAETYPDRCCIDDLTIPTSSVGGVVSTMLQSWQSLGGEAIHGELFEHDKARREYCLLSRDFKEAITRTLDRYSHN